MGVVLALLTAFTTDNFAGIPGRPGEDGNFIPSKLKSATVYRSGAELVHTAKAFLRQGNNDLVIEDISNTLEVNSIRIGSTSTVTILSVEFTKEFLKPEIPSPLIKKLQDSVEKIERELENLSVLMKSDNDLLDLLVSNKKIGGEQNGLSVAELSKMMDYYKQKSLELREDLSTGKEREDRLNKTLERLDAQIVEEDKKNGKTSGRILLQLMSPLAGEVEFTISYLTSAAYWNPSYDLRVDNIAEPMKLVYKAALVQTSGIDWKQVRLTLSASVPSQGGNAPVLKTWLLHYVDPVALLDENLKSNSAAYLQGRLAGVSVKRSYNEKQLDEVVVSALGTTRMRGAASINEEPVEKSPLYFVNGQEMSQEDFEKINTHAIEKIETLKSTQATSLYGSRASGGAVVVTLKGDLGDYVSVNDNVMNVSFDIDVPYDVPTNGKEQRVVLKEYSVPVSYKYYSVPRLDKDAYLLGGVQDWAKLNLLPGDANIIFEGTYIGHSSIDPNSTQDTLNLTLGRDRRVVVKREKVVDYSSVKFLGGNKKQIFTYEITVKNNKKEAIQMILKDQHPISSNKDIEEELLESSGAEVNDDTGILTWKVSLAPGESKKYKMSYSIKYPKDKTVNTN